jgi:hypothetical protein
VARRTALVRPRKDGRGEGRTDKRVDAACAPPVDLVVNRLLVPAAAVARRSNSHWCPDGRPHRDRLPRRERGPRPRRGCWCLCWARRLNSKRRRRDDAGRHGGRGIGGGDARPLGRKLRRSRDQGGLRRETLHRVGPRGYQARAGELKVGDWDLDGQSGPSRVLRGSQLGRIGPNHRSVRRCDLELRSWCLELGLTACGRGALVWWARGGFSGPSSLGRWLGWVLTEHRVDPRLSSPGTHPL